MFALQAARPSRGSDDHIKWRSVPSPVGGVKVVSSISTSMPKYNHTQVKCLLLLLLLLLFFGRAGGGGSCEKVCCW